MLLRVVYLDELVGRLGEIDRAVHVLLFFLVLFSNRAVGNSRVVFAVQYRGAFLRGVRRLRRGKQREWRSARAIATLPGVEVGERLRCARVCIMLGWGAGEAVWARIFDDLQELAVVLLRAGSQVMREGLVHGDLV